METSQSKIKNIRPLILSALAGAVVTSVAFAATGGGWGTLPQVASGDALSTAAWNAAIGQLNSIAGAVTVDGTHLAGTAPTADGHLATKAYVDAAAGGGTQYLGLTSSSYNGNLGGFAGANAKCQANFAGSHMCSVREVIESGRSTDLADNGWIRFESSTLNNTSWHFDGMLSNVGYNSPYSNDCYGWRSGTSTNAAIVLGTTYLNRYTCDSVQKIHCCK